MPLTGELSPSTTILSFCEQSSAFEVNSFRSIWLLVVKDILPPLIDLFLFESSNASLNLGVSYLVLNLPIMVLYSTQLLLYSVSELHIALLSIIFTLYSVLYSRVL
jgi:hypothetical protein